MQMGLSGNKLLSLCQDNETRWNSKYKMLKRALELKEALIPTLAIRNLDITISNAQWTLMEKVCNWNCSTF